MNWFVLQEGEHILAQTRKHWIILLRDTLGTIVVGIVPFALLGVLSIPGMIPTENATFVHLLAFGEIMWALLIWLALFALWTNYYLDLWIITNHRVANVDQVNLFRRTVTTWQFENIQEITTETTNPLQSVFSYGFIHIRTAGPSGKETRMEGIPHPEKIAALMQGQTERFHKLEEKNKGQETLLHTLSHEVKAHLTKNQAALAAIVEGDYGVVPDNLKKMAGSALSETRKGVSMVMNMLSNADLKTGAMQFAAVPLDFGALVRDVYETAKKNAEMKKLTMSCTIAPNSYGVKGDAAQLRDHVVRNMIDNAINYTPSGFIRITLSRSDRAIIFAVADSGVGIAPQDMEKLFTEGGAGEHAHEINPTSTGFGLAIAKRIVEAHGGTMWAESEGAGHGSTFYVSLPVLELPQKSEAQSPAR